MRTVSAAWAIEVTPAQHNASARTVLRDAFLMSISLVTPDFKDGGEEGASRRHLASLFLWGEP